MCTVPYYAHQTQKHVESPNATRSSPQTQHTQPQPATESGTASHSIARVSTQASASADAGQETAQPAPTIGDPGHLTLVPHGANPWSPSTQEEKEPVGVPSESTETLPDDSGSGAPGPHPMSVVEVISDGDDDSDLRLPDDSDAHPASDSEEDATESADDPTVTKIQSQTPKLSASYRLIGTLKTRYNKPTKTFCF